jgi:copper transport protein
MTHPPFAKLSRKRKLIVASIFGALLVFQSSAFGHARLIRSRPEANSKLEQAPKSVELWFSEELESTASTIIVTDQNGKHVDKNKVTLAEGNKKLQIDLEELGSGTYTVEWQALSTDQHTMKGKFTFSVTPAAPAGRTTPSPLGAPSPSQPTPAQGQATTPRSESMEKSGSSWAQSIARWFEYLTMMMLFGGFAFYLFVLKPALQPSASTQTDESAESSEGVSRLIFVSGICIALFVVACSVELVLQASTVFDKSISEVLSLKLLRQLITQTGFGKYWLLQASSTIALLVVVVFIVRQTKRRSRSNSDFLWWAGLAAGALLLIAPTLTGHAAVAAKEYPFAKTTDWLHLAAAGVWVGGLFHLALTMPKALSTLKPLDRLRVLHRVIPLFTRLAVVSTIVIVLTGVYNSWMHVDGFGKLWSTGYGKTLSIKVLLVIPMLILGGVNTFVFHPRATRLIDSGNADARDSAVLDQNFSRSVRIEAVLGVVVLLVASILVFQQPAREHPENDGTQGLTSQPMKK